MGSVVVVQGLSCLRACGIFLDQDGTHVLCFGRRILSHWTWMSLLLLRLSLVAASRCCSSCDVWVSHRRSFSCGAQAPGMQVSVVAAHGL